MGMRLLFVGVLIAVIVALVLILPGILFPAPKDTLDTKTHSIEVAGFYGRGEFTGELLESDIIVTNVTIEGLSQSIKFRGAICPRVSGLGRVYLDGLKANEPDALYKVYVNGFLQFTHTMELGDSSSLTACMVLVEKDYILIGQTTGIVRAEVSVYIFDFARGAGAYEVLVHDTARLSTA